ncbi:unnamed protein product [Cuscuta campestris]|uniref:C2H2-type domain-containing protein n=1 Tax=Cuscuta campestris TaxID=132261 RepID=A0A484LK19_9ASTE|nr:unnamed protein product [Cuscuta campestris]
MKEFNNNGGDFLAGFSWPPRSYTCSFCRREFRSAQALGGHMNVHRRDRARLRHSPPPPQLEGHYPTTTTTTTPSSSPLLLNLNLDPIHTTPTSPSPNPNPNPSFSTTLLTSLPPSPPRTRRFPGFVQSFVPSSSGGEVVAGRWSTVEGIPVNRRHHVVAANYRVKGYKSEVEVVMLKKAEIGKVDLKIGFKEDLDLELRLGYT